MADGTSIVCNFLDAQGHGPCFEMEKGLDALNDISCALGYTNEGYHRGSAFENFIRDNPGAVQAIMDWIAKQTDKSTDWQEKLAIDEDESEEDDQLERESPDDQT